MRVKLGTLTRVDVTGHGTELGLPTLQEHFPHLARRDLACLLFCDRAEATKIARGAIRTWATKEGVEVVAVFEDKATSGDAEENAPDSGSLPR